MSCHEWACHFGKLKNLLRRGKTWSKSAEFVIWMHGLFLLMPGNFTLSQVLTRWTTPIMTPSQFQSSETSFLIWILMHKQLVQEPTKNKKKTVPYRMLLAGDTCGVHLPKKSSLQSKISTQYEGWNLSTSPNSRNQRLNLTPYLEEWWQKPRLYGIYPICSVVPFLVTSNQKSNQDSNQPTILQQHHKKTTAKTKVTAIW